MAAAGLGSRVVPAHAANFAVVRRSVRATRQRCLVAASDIIASTIASPARTRSLRRGARRLFCRLSGPLLGILFDVLLGRFAKLIGGKWMKLTKAGPSGRAAASSA